MDSTPIVELVKALAPHFCPYCRSGHNLVLEDGEYFHRYRYMRLRIDVKECGVKTRPCLASSLWAVANESIKKLEAAHE